jgi:hypothetical protein
MDMNWQDAALGMAGIIDVECRRGEAIMNPAPSSTQKETEDESRAK